MIVYVIGTSDGHESTPWEMVADDRELAHAVARWEAHRNRRSMQVQAFDLSAGRCQMLPHSPGMCEPTAEYVWADTRLPKVTTVAYDFESPRTDVNYYDPEHGDMAMSGLLCHRTVYAQIVDRIKAGKRAGTVWARSAYSPMEVRYDFTVTDPLPTPPDPDSPPQE